MLMFTLDNEFAIKELNSFLQEVHEFIKMMSVFQRRGLEKLKPKIAEADYDEFNRLASLHLSQIAKNIDLYVSVQQTLYSASGVPYNANTPIPITKEKFATVIDFLHHLIVEEDILTKVKFFVPFSYLAALHKYYGEGLYQKIGTQLDSGSFTDADKKFFAESLKKSDGTATAAREVTAKGYFTFCTAGVVREPSNYDMKWDAIIKYLDKKGTPEQRAADPTYQKVVALRNKFVEHARAVNKKMDSITADSVDKDDPYNRLSTPVPVEKGARGAAHPATPTASQNIGSVNLVASVLRVIAFCKNNLLGKKIAKEVGISPPLNANIAELDRLETHILNCHYDTKKRASRDHAETYIKSIKSDNWKFQTLINMILDTYYPDPSTPPRISTHRDDYNKLMALIDYKASREIDMGKNPSIHFIAQYAIQQVIVIVDKYYIRDAKAFSFLKASGRENDVIGDILNALGDLYSLKPDELKGRIDGLPIASERNIPDYIAHVINSKAAWSGNLRTKGKHFINLMNEIGRYLDDILGCKPGTMADKILRPTGQTKIQKPHPIAELRAGAPATLKVVVVASPAATPAPAVATSAAAASGVPALAVATPAYATPAVAASAATTSAAATPAAAEAAEPTVVLEPIESPLAGAKSGAEKKSGKGPRVAHHTESKSLTKGKQFLAEYIEIIKEFYVTKKPKTKLPWDKRASAMADLAQLIGKEHLYQVGEMLKTKLPRIIEHYKRAIDKQPRENRNHFVQLIERLEDFQLSVRNCSFPETVQLDRKAVHIFERFVTNFYRSNDRDNSYYTAVQSKLTEIKDQKFDAKNNLVSWITEMTGSCRLVKLRDGLLGVSRRITAECAASKDDSSAKAKVIDTVPVEAHTTTLIGKLLQTYDCYSNNMFGDATEINESQRWHPQLSHIVSYAISLYHHPKPFFATQCLIHYIQKTIIQIRNHGIRGRYSRLANTLAGLVKEMGYPAEIVHAEKMLPLCARTAMSDDELKQHRLLAKDNEIIIDKLLHIVDCYEKNHIGQDLIKSMPDELKKKIKTDQETIALARKLRLMALKAYKEGTSISKIVAEINQVAATSKNENFTLSLKWLASHFGGESYVKNDDLAKVPKLQVVLKRRYDENDSREAHKFIKQHFVTGKIVTKDKEDKEKAKGIPEEMADEKKIGGVAESKEGKKKEPSKEVVLDDSVLILITQIIRIVAYYMDTRMGQSILNEIKTHDVPRNKKNRWSNQAYRIAIEALKTFETNPALAKQYLVNKIDEIVEEIQGDGWRGENSRLANTLAGLSHDNGGRSEKDRELPALPEQVYTKFYDPREMNDETRNYCVDTIFKFAIQTAAGDVENYKNVCDSRFFKTADIKNNKSNLIGSKFNKIFTELDKPKAHERQPKRDKILNKGSISSLLQDIVDKYTIIGNTEMNIFKDGKFGEMITSLRKFIGAIKADPAEVQPDSPIPAASPALKAR